MTFLNSSTTDNSSFAFIIVAKIYSPKQPNTSLTFSTRSTSLETSRPRPIGTFALGFFTLRCVSDLRKPETSLDIFRSYAQHRDAPATTANGLERAFSSFSGAVRPWSLPPPPFPVGPGLEEEGAVEIHHPLSLERFLLHAGERS